MVKMKKIFVRVKTSLGEYTKFLQPSLDGYVLIQPENKKKKIIEWKLHITKDDVYWTKRRFKLTPTIDVIQYADKPVSYDIDNKTSKAPPFDFYAMKKHSDENILKHRGESIKPKTNGIIYVVIILNIIILVMMFLLLNSMGVF